MANSLTPTQRIFVVDANSVTYPESTMGPWDFRDAKNFANGREALRSNPEESPTMWMINAQLTDMRGADLVAMLRSRGSNNPMTIVSDSYSVEDEMEARQLGTMYFVKPIEQELLQAAG